MMVGYKDDGTRRYKSFYGKSQKEAKDKADARKIAKYGLDNWTDLREYTPMEAIREQLKLASRQYDLYMKNVVALQNNLISETIPKFV